MRPTHRHRHLSQMTAMGDEVLAGATAVCEGGVRCVCTGPDMMPNVALRHVLV